MVTRGEKGVYVLLIRLKKNQVIQVGRLGKFTFPRGYYTYTGSALAGIENRLKRHLRKDKRLHWHIDYLLTYATIIKHATIITNEKIECQVNKFLLSQKGARIIAPGFGSSDCRCISHLIYWGNKKPDVLISKLGKITPAQLIDPSTK
ncbi:GIY-YIG nuclease family protein [Candidatus Sumerlaeota bacterium]|nr:GIY-YIG nuclease family protein [Candidatus Sumerlaeota bacterium]